MFHREAIGMYRDHQEAEVSDRLTFLGSANFGFQAVGHTARRVWNR